MKQTFEQRAELIADFIEATNNKYSRLHNDNRLFEALTAYNNAYEERRTHGFSEARREAYIAGIAKLLGNQ
jgi:hypothetical protein